MKKHVRQIHGKRMDPKSSLDNHVNMEIEETIMYSCKKCESEFKTKNELNKHNTTVHEEKKLFKCDTCQANFAEKAKLSAHIKSKHENVKKIIHYTTVISVKIVLQQNNT